jgi:cell division protein FtsW
MNRKHRAELAIGVLMVILMMVGLVVIYAIGPARVHFENSVYGTETAESYYFVKQLITVVLAVIAMIVAYKIPIGVWRRAGKWIFIAGVLLCATLAVLGAMKVSFAKCSLGACRWFDLGLVSFQPVEVLKLGALIYLAGLLAERKRGGKLEKMETLVPIGVVMALTVGLVAILQKDLGTTVVMSVMVIAMMIVSGMKWRILAIIGGVLVFAAIPLVLLFPHRVDRIMGFSDDYHTNNALVAIGTGGMFGVGVGNSVQAMGYLPESINDSVFAVMGETFGFVGLALILGCYGAMLLKMLKVAERSEEVSDKLIVVGVFGWLVSHVVINTVGMTGMMPIKGITLPFLSYGGTSMIFAAIGVGVVLQISCYTSREVKKHEDSSSRRGVGGAYYAGARGHRRNT